MAEIAGKGGSLKVGANTVASVKSWSVDSAIDMQDTTSLGVDDKTYISGLTGWTMNAEASFRVHDDTNGQTAINTAHLGGTSVTINGYVNGSNYYSGTAFISGLRVNTTVDGLVTISLTLQGSGALTFN